MIFALPLYRSWVDVDVARGTRLLCTNCTIHPIVPILTAAVHAAYLHAHAHDMRASRHCFMFCRVSRRVHPCSTVLVCVIYRILIFSLFRCETALPLQGTPCSSSLVSHSLYCMLYWASGSGARSASALWRLGTWQRHTGLERGRPAKSL